MSTDSDLLARYVAQAQALQAQIAALDLTKEGDRNKLPGLKSALKSAVHMINNLQGGK